jgi:vacuole morphology and inheritance protein 14
LTVLDSVPELELVSYLPEFLDGLLKYLGDPTVDIRTATQNVLADFLREIREVAEVQKTREEWEKRELLEEGERRTSESSAVDNDASTVGEGETEDEGEQYAKGEGELGDEEGFGQWIPGQGVRVDHAAIVEILLEHLSFPGASSFYRELRFTDQAASDEEIQSTCLRWIAEFLLFCQPTMVPLTPRLLPVILSSLAHHVVSIRTAANETNYNLYKVIQVRSSPIPHC